MVQSTLVLNFFTRNFYTFFKSFRFSLLLLISALFSSERVIFSLIKLLITMETNSDASVITPYRISVKRPVEPVLRSALCRGGRFVPKNNLPKSLNQRTMYRTFDITIEKGLIYSTLK